MFLKTAKKSIGVYIKIIQRVLLFVCLAVVYFIGVGFTALVMAVFNRRVLSGCGRNDDTFWVKAKGYDKEIDDGKFQS